MISNSINDMKTMDYSTAIDWMSIKLLGTGMVLLAISGSIIITVLSGVAFASTIIYNVIKIYKEIKNKK